jgi:hypothetical protein
MKEFFMSAVALCFTNETVTIDMVGFLDGHSGAVFYRLGRA